MTCPRCGNEISQEEAFCGQCGTSTLLPIQPGETVQRSGLLSSYDTNMAPPSNAGMLPPQTQNDAPPGLSLPSRRPLTPGQPQPPVHPSATQGPNGFYANPTEIISLPPGNEVQQYPQQGFPRNAGPYAPQGQPLRLGNYASPSYPQTPSSGPAYGYGMQPQMTPPPRQPRSNTVLIIASIFLIVAVLMVTGLGAFYLLRSRSPQAGTAAPTSVATTTTISNPTPTVAANTPTAVPTPSPTAAPSPIADAGFTFCDATCTSNGFSVEYPKRWHQGTTNDNTGVQFASGSAPDEFAAFKVAGSTSANANDLVGTDLQTNFAPKVPYMPPTSSQSTTIGGVTWVYSQASYTLSGQTEHVQVYATVRQGKAYLIELNASDSRFDTVNTKYFVTMLASFKFQ